MRRHSTPTCDVYRISKREGVFQSYYTRNTGTVIPSGSPARSLVGADSPRSQRKEKAKSYSRLNTHFQMSKLEDWQKHNNQIFKDANASTPVDQHLFIDAFGRLLCPYGSHWIALKQDKWDKHQGFGGDQANGNVDRHAKFASWK